MKTKQVGHLIDPKILKFRVMAIVGISPDEYAKYVWDLGLLYASLHLGGDEYGVRVITRAKYYWSWWQNQWNIIDLAFISSPFVPGDERGMYMKLYEGVKLMNLKEYWLELHNPEQLVAYPGKVVWDEVHELCIAEVISKSHEDFNAALKRRKEAGK